MEKKKKNPNSHKLARRDSSNPWSELPPDLFNSVFERLGFADFRRAVSVCSSWYSASKRCVTKNHTPVLILFSDDNNKHSSCTLFNPEEKGKVYKRGVEFAKTSVCLATYGSWLFMLEDDDYYNLYILNILTNERINLPSVESQLGTTKVERTEDDWFRISNDHDLRESKGISIKSSVFWIDEQTKDYVVLWGFGRWCLVYSKKGDTSWNQIPLVSSICSDMVYKDHKLYLITTGRFGGSSMQIFDFSGEMIPRETFQCSGIVENVFDLSLHQNLQRNSWMILATKLVVTVTGDVLKVEKMVRPMTGIWSFRIYKVFNNYEQVDSLGNEAMLFDLGVTVLATKGFKRNFIYSNTICRVKKTSEICLFNLETQKMEETPPLYKFDCSSTQQLARARWFLPSFTHT